MPREVLELKKETSANRADVSTHPLNQQTGSSAPSSLSVTAKDVIHRILSSSDREPTNTSSCLADSLRSISLKSEDCSEGPPDLGRL